MSKNPINLAVRFVLETVALVATGIWAWHQTDGVLQYVLATGTPLLLAAIWGTFNVPDDPSRSGKAPVKVPGFIRLFIELVFFAFATWCLINIGHVMFGWIMGAVLVIHYIISYDRIQWLLSQGSPKDSKA